MKRIIYEKVYDKSIDIEMPEEETEQFNAGSTTAEEFIRSLTEETEYVLVEERIKGLDEFIKAVKEITVILEFDVEIYEEPFGASADIKITDCTLQDYVKKIFMYMLFKADAISWFKKDDYILLSLDYYTHELFYKGKCMHRIK